jgi:deazaflavin-dependent oxidoreductase (nitroreductase family)
VEFSGPPRRPTGLRRALFRLPLGLYRAHLGVVLGHRFVLINHVGRTTGRPRQVVVEIVDRDPATGAVTAASGFGPKSDWYRNLLAHPDVTIQTGRRRRSVRAVALSEVEAADAMAGYARRHPRAARALSRFMGFGVDGSEADYRAVGREIPMVRFVPDSG